MKFKTIILIGWGLTGLATGCAADRNPGSQPQSSGTTPAQVASAPQSPSAPSTNQTPVQKTDPPTSAPLLANDIYDESTWIIPEMLATSSLSASKPVPVGTGISSVMGYLLADNCELGEVSSTVTKGVTQAFASPLIISSGNSPSTVPGNIRVVFTAQSPYRKVYTMEPHARADMDALQFASSCGNQFLVHTEIGGRIAISVNFQVDPGQQNAFIAQIQKQMKDLTSIDHFDVSEFNFKFSGGSLDAFGNGVSKALQSAMAKCFTNEPGSCSAFVAQAYADATSMSQHFTKSYVQQETPTAQGLLSFQVKSYVPSGL